MNTYDLDKIDNLKKLSKETLINIIKDLLLEKKELETEINCPISVVFTALRRKRVYMKYIDEGKLHTVNIANLYFDKYSKEWFFWCDGVVDIKVNDYNKLWWLESDMSE